MSTPEWKSGKLTVKLGANAGAWIADAEAGTITHKQLFRTRTYPAREVLIQINKPQLSITRGALGGARSRVSHHQWLADLPGEGRTYAVVPARRVADAYRFAVLYSHWRAAGCPADPSPTITPAPRG